MAKKKIYAVACGRKTGIFADWSTVEKLVKGYPKALYKGFTSETEARLWLSAPVLEKKTKSTQPIKESSVPDLQANDIVIYTDGGCINNPGPGGYGFVIKREGQQLEYSGGFRMTTNNRMELTAAIVALEKLGKTTSRIHLFSDSSYLVNGIEKGWARKWQSNGWRKSDGSEPANLDLWQSLLALLTPLNVVFYWVRGHAGDADNERCDQLALAASRSNPSSVDTVYEQGCR
ncbi:MAG: ribonuclease HI [Deltaproteobacteria bacterium]|nr:MAG: ribonuclease HI [Deltaproteobacteria bacterium]PIE72479.1 MAG: ribonuclease HI [Deltaproteobacteria bacterium]